MAISYLYTGEPMNGTANDDFVIAYKGSTGTDNNTVNGNGGDDLVIGDSSDTWIPGASYLNGSISDAFNLETLTGTWTTAENPMFGDYTIPHTTVIAEATIGQSEYYRVQIAAGQQITIDLDFASNTSIGSPRDLVVELQDSLGNIIATADDSLVTDGGQGSTPSTQGSASSYDPYLVYTVANAGIYYINVRPFGGGPGSVFTENNTFVMNVSVTGHATAASNPVQGLDLISGGEGNDTLFGQGGADTINGDAGDDFIDSGSGGDIVHGGEGDDTLYGGDGTEENIHGDNGNDKLVSGGEGHYYGDAGDDLILAGITSGVNEVLDGGTGVDTLDTRTWNGTYTINLVTGATNFGEIFTNFENVITGNGTDTITGTTGDNVITTNAGVDTVFADAGNDRVSGGADGDTLDGGAGTDLLDYRLSSGAVTVNLATGSASGGHAAGDIISNFEGVWGSVLGDTLTGNTGDNELRGFEGNDILVGGDGNDTLDGGINDDAMGGGIGNDTYYVDSVGDTVTELTNQGVDTIMASFTYSIAALANVEWLRASDPSATTAINLTGNAAGNRIYGNAGNNSLSGGGGDDLLDSGAGDDLLNGGAGNDAMIGGAGNDVYVLNDTGDTITEAVGGGTDSVTLMLPGAGNYVLANNVERMVVSSNSVTAHGNALDNVITDSGTGNTLFGEGGNDTLNGNANANILDGGIGNDIMKGGLGDDTYRVDSLSDQVIELAGQGTDTIETGLAWTLGAEIENLTLTGAAAINGTGNALANVLTGNSAANILDGGAGNDTMKGGLGDDIYILDNASDVVVELAGQGVDTVTVGFSYSIAAVANVEWMRTIDPTATTAINLTGNSIGNRIYGNAGNNSLSGGGGDDLLDSGAGDDTLNGGAGNDAMIGGAGNDVYVLNDTGDTITEAVGGGTDSVTLLLPGAGNYVLANNVERMVVSSNSVTAHGNALDNTITNNGTGNTLYGETGNDTLNGNSSADLLHGGAGNDKLKGGAGNDILWGDADNDIFLFATGNGVDEIADFTHAADKIDLTLFGIASFAALQGMMSQVGSDTMIDLGSGNSIKLDGVTMATLNAGDFILSGGGTAVEVPVPLANAVLLAQPAQAPGLQDTGTPDSIAALAGMAPVFDSPTYYYEFS